METWELHFGTGTDTSTKIDTITGIDTSTGNDTLVPELPIWLDVPGGRLHLLLIMELWHRYGYPKIGWVASK